MLPETSPSPSPDRRASPRRPLLAVLRSDTGSAGLLLAATLIALIWANSPAADAYSDIWGTHIKLGVGSFSIDEDLRHWVNDGLMVLFFFVIGLEVRRELAEGDLRDPRVAAIPALAALAGMLVPALLYFAINAGGPGANGWGIVMATDIAFVLGALAMLGSRVPIGVRIFLLTLAVVDDIGAIAVIAIFYAASIDLVALAIAAGILVATIGLLRWRSRTDGRTWGVAFFVVAGLLLWVATLKSGIHPTVAGVLMGLLVPVHPPREGGWSLNARMQARILPWSSLVVIPLFALANAGVVLGDGVFSRAITSPVTIGVVVGLVLGKLLGVALFTIAAVRLGVGGLPTGMRTRHAIGAGGLAGIGFTVSLFVADLAFTDPALQDEAKIGVLLASVIALIVGSALLLRSGSGDPERD